MASGMKSLAFLGVLLLVCQLGCLVNASRQPSSWMMREPPTYVLGYAICDSCWEMGVTANSVLLPNVTAVIECMDAKGGISFRQIGTTDKTGAFLVQLPAQIADSISQLSTCRSRVIDGPSNHPCSVASIQANPFLALQSLPDGREVYGVGPFMFRPRERFPFCKDSAASRQVGGGKPVFYGRKSQLSTAQLSSPPAGGGSTPTVTTMQSNSNGNGIQLNLSLQISASATCNSNSSPSNASPSSNASASSNASTYPSSPNPFPSWFPMFPIPGIPPIPAIPAIPTIPLIPSIPSIPSVPAIPALPLSTPSAPSPQPDPPASLAPSTRIPAPAPSPASAPR